MISLPHHLPFVRIGANSLTVFQEDWLDQIIVEAAANSQIPEWLANDISRGVCQYLENSYEGSVIDLDELYAKVKGTLIRLGLPHVAQHLEMSPPPLRISLTDLARRAGGSYELAFFQLLEDKCKDALDSGASFIELHGLVNCVKTLTGARRWSSHSDVLRFEIEKRIDEFRLMGELTKPVFNVSVSE